MLDKNNSATDNVTDLVNIKHDGNICRMLCSLPRSCLVHTIDRFDSEGWFSCDHVIFSNVFRVFLGDYFYPIGPLSICLSVCLVLSVTLVY